MGAAGILPGCQSGGPSTTEDGVTVESVRLQAPEGAQAFTPTLDGPLRILSATPQGALRRMPDRQPIAVTFSRPMVPLGDTPPVPEGAFSIDPAVTGSYRWEGTQTLIFTPEQPLPPATAYTVTLNPVVQSPDGETIDAPYTWTFETPRPRLVRSEPADGAGFASPDTDIRLHFNLPVSANLAREYVSGRPDRLVGSVENDGDSTLVITPTQPLARGEQHAVVLESGLPTTAGPLGLETRTEVNFRVHPQLDVEAVDQPGYRPNTLFYPNRGIEIRTSTPVRFEALRTAVSFTPSVDWPQGIEAQDSRESTTHTLPVQLEPETAYEITVEGLEDVFGQTAPTTRSTVRTRAYEPSLRMDTGLMVVEAEQYAVLPVRATNVETMRLGMTRIRLDDIVPSLETYDDRRYYGRDAASAEPREPVEADRVVDLGLDRNTPSLYPLYLDSMLTAGSGIVGVRLQWDDPTRRGTREVEHRALAQVTNLGVTGKFSPHRTLVFVTNLGTGRPVANADVQIRGSDNQVYWTGTTDARGRAAAPGWAGLGISQEGYGSPAQYAIVEHQGDVAFTGSPFDDGVEPYRFGVNYDWNPAPRTIAGSAFTDRGLYKTGDTVYLKAILREKTDSDWSSVTDSVRLMVLDPRDETVLDRTVAPSALGTLDDAWTVPRDAAQGRYEIRLAKTGIEAIQDDYVSSRDPVVTGRFRVDSFRRATFSVEATTPADAYVAGDFFEGRVSGRYLFGAGMAGQPVTYSLLRTDARYRPPGYNGYRFGPLDDYTYDNLARGDTTLDSTSTASLRTQLPASDTGAPTTLRWTGTVTSPDRQSISDQAEVLLHPGLFYVGLKPETSFLDLTQDSVLTADVISVDPNGTPVGGKTINVELVRIEWNSVREVGSDGRLRWRSERTEETVARTDITTASGSAQRLRMPLSKGGRYELRARAQDVRGNTIRSQTTLYASGRGYVAWQRGDDDRIELIAETTDYAPGETARLMIQNPYEEATALITVEREGILESRVQRVTGSTPQISIPLQEKHIPNVYVSVILLNGRTAPPRRTSDPGAPGFKIGYASLTVDPGLRRLNVAVTPDQEEYRPGEEVTVNLRLTDASGSGVPGEIAFSAADAGVLNRIGYRLPDPFDAFYGPRPLGVTTAESRANLVEQRSYGQKAQPIGGGGGTSESMVRKDFRPLAHWAPAVQTDASGRAQVTFKLPESLTTFRFMAAAATADHTFGRGSTDVTVTQPLVLQPALPRFARLGDLFDAGVLVSNRTDTPGTAVVRAEADGLTLQSGDTRSIQLPPGATREVRFAWDALQAGTATLRFDAELNGETDAFQTTLEVQRPRTKIASGQFASTTGGAEEQVRFPANRVPGLGQLDVQLSSTALVGLDGAVEYLFDYPYGCLEQTTSRIRPLLVGTEMLEMFDLDVLGGNRNRLVTEWLNGLDAYWMGDGFGLWPEARASNPYVTAYAVLALAEAQSAGYAVPQPLTDDAVDALARTVRQSGNRPDFYTPAVWADTRALMLYALARHDRVLESEISALAESPPESVDGISYLLRTVATANSAVLGRFETQLAERLEGRIRVEATRAYLNAPDDDGYGWIFASDVRATAFGLSALLAQAPSADRQPLAQRMIRYLMEQRTQGHWASTQDNAAVVDAFRAYVEAYEDDTPDLTATVRLAGKQILQARFQGRTLTTADTSLSADAFPQTEARTVPLQINADGAGRLYYTLRLQAYTRGPVEAARQGLSVVREIQRLDDRGEPVGDWMTTGENEIVLTPGRLVRVRLRLRTATPRTYVVLDDALPAGLEPLNTAFQTTNTAVTDEAGAGQSRWWGSFNHTELRDDRVLLFADYLREGEHTYTYVARATTPGTFVHPPADAEMMYAPETRGRTGSGVFRVEAGAAQAARGN